MGVIAKYVLFLTWVGIRWGVLDHLYIRKKGGLHDFDVVFES